jgi:hypothetical protein
MDCAHLARTCAYNTRTHLIFLSQYNKLLDMGNFPIYYSSMSHLSAKPSPAAAAGATSSISVAAAMNLIRPLFRFAIRLAIKSGLKYAEIDESIRAELFFEARTQCSDEQRTNASKLSLMTGLHRKDISQRLSTLNDPKTSETSPISLSVVSQVFARWAHEVRRNKRAQTLPISNGVRRMSFMQLSRNVVTDVHPRAVLDELIRLGFVSETDGHVKLVSTTFTPTGAADDRLKLFAENASAMLSTGVENILDTRPRQPEYAIWGKGISFDDAKRISDIAMAQWQITRNVIFKAISDAPEAASGDVPYHVRVGLYVNYEPLSVGNRSE